MVTEQAAAPVRPRAELRTFHPGWFAAIMGTGIVAVAAFINPGNLPILQSPLRLLGVGLAWLTYAITVAVGVPYGLRWLRHPAAAWQDFRHPVVGALYGTLPGGILVLAVVTATVGPAVVPSGLVFRLVAGLALVGGALAFAVSVGSAYVLFVHPQVGAETVNGGWFIPPVVNIIVPLALMPLVPAVGPETGRLLLVASWAAWGAGFLMFLLVASLLYGRLIHHPLPAAPLAPSLWIGLGPIGVGGLALMRLAQVGAPHLGELGATVNGLAALGALALWGFGLWWLAISALLLARYVRNGGLPFGMGWWAFTFPLGAYTVDTLTLARTWQVPILEGLGAAFFVVLVGFWLLVAARILRGMLTGETWRR